MMSVFPLSRPWPAMARTLALVFALLLGMAAGGTHPAAAAPDAQAAAALVAHYQAVLQDVMERANSLGTKGRAEALDGPLRETFDYARMARAAAGRTWRVADEAAREAMVEAFARYSVAVHADRFDGYAGERFVLDGTAPAPGDAVFVHTHIDRPNGEEVALSYVVASAEGQGPRVVDVLLDGSISEVALRRSEWAAIGRDQGLAGLAEALQGLAARLLSTEANSPGDSG